MEYRDITVRSSMCVISALRRKVGQNCVILGVWAASGGNFFPTFREKLSVPTSGVTNLRNNTEEHRSLRAYVII